MSACKVIEFYSKSDFIKVYNYISDLYRKLSSNKNQQKTNSIDIIQAITNAISGEQFLFSTKPVLDGGKLAQNAKVHNSKLRESLIQLSIDIYKMLDKLNSTSEKVDMAIIKDSLEKLQYLTNLEGEEGKQYPF
jgi:hypothetical protein